METPENSDLQDTYPSESERSEDTEGELEDDYDLDEEIKTDEMCMWVGYSDRETMAELGDNIDADEASESDTLKIASNLSLDGVIEPDLDPASEVLEMWSGRSSLVITNDLDDDMDADEASENDTLKIASESPLDGVMEPDIDPASEVLEMWSGCSSQVITNDLDEDIDTDELSVLELSCDAELQEALLSHSGATAALEVDVNPVEREQAQTETEEEAQSTSVRARPDGHQLAPEDQTLGSKHEDSTHEGQLSQEEQAQFSREDNHWERLKEVPAEELLHDQETQSKEEAVPQTDGNTSKSQAQTEDASSQQQQEDAGEVGGLTYQQLASENERLRARLTDAQRDLCFACEAAMDLQDLHKAELVKLRRQNDELALTNQRLQSELRDAVLEMQGAGEDAISQQCKLDQLTGENHQLRCENVKEKKELEKVRAQLCLARDIQEEHRAELDSLRRQRNQVASDNHRLQSQLGDAECELQVASVVSVSQGDKLDHLTKSHHQLVNESIKALAELKELQADISRAHNAVMDMRRETEKHKAELDELASRNYLVASENQRLKLELQDAARQHQEDREACSRLEGQVKEERAQTLRANMQLERQQEALKSAEPLMYDTLKMENKYIISKIEALEYRYNLMVEQREALADSKHVTLNRAVKAQLQQIICELKAEQSESRVRQAHVEKALNQERIEKAVLEERCKNMAATAEKERRRATRCVSALKKERGRNKTYSVELMEARINLKLREPQSPYPSSAAQSDLCLPPPPPSICSSSGNDDDSGLNMGDTTDAVDDLEKN